MKTLFIFMILTIFTSCELQKFERPVAENDEEQATEMDNEAQDVENPENEFDEDVINDEDDDSSDEDAIPDESCNVDNDCEDGFECFEDKCIPEKSFISKWNTAFYGISSEKQIMLPLVENGTYDFTVFWGDGAYNKITKWNDPALTHTYPEPGIYNVIISGTFEGWQFCKVTDAGCAVSDAAKIIDISRWSGLVLGDTEFQFAQCWNLDITAEDVPDLSKTKSLRGAFANCNTLTGSESFNNWNVSGIQNMSRMFYQADKFNQNISSWNVSNVTDMTRMFESAVAFNNDLSGWDVSNVTDMSEMFYQAGSFNQDISDWDVSNVTNMVGMFLQASSFNSDISSWDVSEVTGMSGMFYFASSFNSDLSKWNVSQVTGMWGMFYDASSFNSDLSEWDVSGVITMNSMFNNSASFNSDLSGWDVSNVTDMSYMFEKAALFDSDLSGWDVSNVTDMSGMFEGVTLSTVNYDAILNGWSELVLQNDVDFHGGNSKYSSAGEAARAKIISDFNWTITDGGME